VRFSLRVG